MYVRANENDIYKAFIAQLPTSGRSDLHKNRGARNPGGRGEAAERENGSLIRDQIMILRGIRLTKETGRGSVEVFKSFGVEEKAKDPLSTPYSLSLSLCLAHSS